MLRRELAIWPEVTEHSALQLSGRAEDASSDRVAGAGLIAMAGLDLAISDAVGNPEASRLAELLGCANGQRPTARL